MSPRDFQDNNSCGTYGGYGEAGKGACNNENYPTEDGTNFNHRDHREVPNGPAEASGEHDTMEVDSESSKEEGQFTQVD